MILTDTHCHLDLDRFSPDREAVIARAGQAGVARILIPSLDLDSAKRVLALASTHSSLYAGVGFHPTGAGGLDDPSLLALQELASSEKVVAVGEVGLDYFWVIERDRRIDQQAALRAQLEIAAALSLPVILHMREQNDAEDGVCADDLLRMLEDWVRGLRSQAPTLVGRAGVLHSFSGSLKTAIHAIDLGFYIGITGPITYPKAARRREIVQKLPLHRMLIETDAPFLAPHLHRGQRNEPAFVRDIADRIAHVQSRTASEVADATTRNAARLFAWGEPG